MRVLVVGASGRTGRRLLETARARRFQVRALSRTPLIDPPVGVETVLGDVNDETALERAMQGCDAVLCALGPRKDSPPDLCSAGTAHLVAAMKRSGVNRLVCVTGALIGHPPEHLGVLYRCLRQRRSIAQQLEERRLQERLLIESGLDWTIVRPARLSNRKPRGRVVSGGRLHLGALASVSRGGLAAYMLDALSQPALSRQAVAVVD